MSDREEQDFGFDQEEDFPAEGEEFTLGVADDEEDDAVSESPFSDDDLFTVSDGEDVVLEDEADDDFVALTSEPSEPEAVEIGDEGPLLFGVEAETEAGENPLFEAEEDLAPARRGSPARLLMLVLLVLLAGASAFYFLVMPGTDLAPEVAKSGTAVSTAKQPISLPAKPLARNLPATSGDPLPAGARPQAGAGTAVAAKEPGAGETLPAAVKAPVVPAAKVASPQSESAKQVPAAGAGAAAVVPQKATVQAAADKRPADSPPAAVKAHKPVSPSRGDSPAVARVKPKYQVQVGAFLLESNLLAAEKKVRKLGFEPRRSEAKKKTSMFRLKYGSFGQAEGRQKLAALKKVDADAFILHEGDRLGVYAGSYVDLDKARHYADLLWDKGIKVKEVKADVEVPLHRLSFGGFGDRKSALDAAARAKSAGLAAQVVAYRQ